MRRTIQAALVFAVATLASGIGFTVAVAILNPVLDVRDLAATGAGSWIGIAILVLLPVAAITLVVRWSGKPVTPDRVALFVAVTLFAFLWFARLEPAHQMVSIHPHLTWLGWCELLLIGASAVAAVATAASAPTVASRIVWTLSVLAGSAIVLVMLAFAVEPDRRREAELQSLSSRVPAQAVRSSTSQRVLVIGLDGLDWRTVEWMIRHGRMPALQRLLSNGRYYQHDNRGMGYSAVIWTAIFNGHSAEDNGIGGFAKWQFAGAKEPIGVFPSFGMHGIFFLDEFFRRVPSYGLWRDLSVTTADAPFPPVWAIASHAGKRVGVYDPVPHEAIPERLNGFFVVNDDLGHELFREGAATREVLVTPREQAGGEFADDRDNAEIAAGLLQRERPDLGIFYTHVLDTVQHQEWMNTMLDDQFDRTRISRAYDLADTIIARLSNSFGSDASIVVVSDHGWEYSDYEHFTSPFGAVVIAPHERPGYGGTADVLGITPTILSLLNLPADSTMTAAIPPIVAARTRERYADTVRRIFATDHVPDAERRQRLRSLGYVEGKPRR
jgi:Type I phosphodiesterase / nucleotide pyrophosphatase